MVPYMSSTSSDDHGAAPPSSSAVGRWLSAPRAAGRLAGDRDDRCALGVVAMHEVDDEARHQQQDAEHRPGRARRTRR